MIPTHNLVGTTILISLIACSTSCATRFTNHPASLDPTLVTKLHRDVSTAQDAKQLLGTPSGYGAVRLPGEAGPRTALFYEKVDYEILPAGSSGEVNFIAKQTVLFVFFKSDRYDGYWWFSNAPPAVATNR